jgi:hypothetical protein
MARRKIIQEKFEALLQRPLSDKDRNTVESLFNHYKTKGNLTQGRRNYLAILEERYSEAKVQERNQKAAASPHRATIDALLADDELNDRDRAFVTKMDDSLKSYGSLTENMAKAIVKIATRNTPEARQARSEWEEKYRSTWRREHAEIAAEYYVNRLEYFSDLALCIKGDPNYVPTEKQFNAMVANKHAQRVIESHTAAPKFEVGQLVSPSSFKTRHHRWSWTTNDTQAVVLEIAPEPVVSAARGAKRYRIALICDLSVQHVVEEREMKNAKFTKKE